jgi:hypothetical protein
VNYERATARNLSVSCQEKSDKQIKILLWSLIDVVPNFSS